MNFRGISQETVKHRLLCMVPVLRWLPSYDKSWLKFDLIAGLTLAAFAIPDNMAYATLAGLPPEYGLYAGIMAPLAYFIFATSRHASVGPSSSEAIMVATFFAAMAIVITSPEQYYGLVALTAILVGIICVVAWLLKLGFLVNLISSPVMKGFLVGTVLVVIVSQIPKILVLSGAPSSFFGKISFILQNLPEINIYALALGIGALVLFFVLEHKFPRLPGTLLVVILSIIFVALTDLAERGVEIVGTIPQGLPELGMPLFSPGDVEIVLPLAIGLFILSFVELSTIARTYAKEHEYEVDNNQELLALGASSVSVGVAQGFPIAGSFSKTAVNDRNNAKTQLSGAIAAGVTILVVLFLTGFFYYLAEPVIAALIIVAVFKMVDIAGLSRIGHINKNEIYFGVISRHPENDVVEGIFIFRIDAPLIVANAEIFKENILSALGREQRPIHVVILDFESSPFTDVTAIDMTKDLISELEHKGIELRIANACGHTRDILRRAGIEEKVGRLDQATSIEAIIRQSRDSHS